MGFDSQEFPSSPTYILTFAFLLLMALVVFAVALFKLFRLPPATVFRNQSKRLFYKALLLLATCRITQLTLFIVWGTVTFPSEWVTKVVLLVLLSTSALSAVYFVLAYGLVLVFWFLFYRIVKEMKMPNAYELEKEVANFVLALQIITIVLSVVYTLLLIPPIFTSSTSIWYWNGSIISVSIIMGLEAIAFFYIGVRLFLATRSIVAIPRNKVIKVVVTAVVVTLFFLLRATLLLGTLDYSGESLSGSPFNNPGEYSAPYWYFMIYYVVCEDIPIFMMVWFLSGVPTGETTKQEGGAKDNFLSPEENEEESNESLALSSNDSQDSYHSFNLEYPGYPDDIEEQLIHQPHQQIQLPSEEQN